MQGVPISIVDGLGSVVERAPEMPIRTLMPPPETQGHAARGTGRTTG
jgi:hypothetical protein